MSYGSGTETRYGTSEPPDHTSATDAVWPPDTRSTSSRPCPRRAAPGRRSRRPQPWSTASRPRHRRTPGCACRRRGRTPGLAHRERVGARDHGRRLQRLDRPAEQDLTRDDPVQVGLQRNRVDDLEPRADVDLELTAVLLAAVLEQRRAGDEDEWTGERRRHRAPVDLQPQPRPERVRARRELVHGARAQANTERRVGSDRRRLRPRRAVRAPARSARLPSVVPR